MSGRKYINEVKPNLVDNWSSQASLLSYGQVAELMEDYSKSLTPSDESLKKDSWKKKSLLRHEINETLIHKNFTKKQLIALKEILNEA